METQPAISSSPPRGVTGPSQRIGVSTRPDVGPAAPLPFSARHVSLVRDGLRRVMEEGTGYWIQIPGISSAGKTGTAQNPRGEDDSVFIMFAPFEEPEIALGVMVENAGFGSTAAGPIASLMAEYYLTGTIAPERIPLLERTLAVESDPLPGAVTESESASSGQTALPPE